MIGPAAYIRELECKYLTALNAKADKMSFNLHHGDGKFTTAGKTMAKQDRSYLLTPENSLKKSLGSKRAWKLGLYSHRKKLLGDDNPSRRPEVRAKISVGLAGLKGGRMTGKKHSEETKQKMAASRKRYWDNRKLMEST